MSITNTPVVVTQTEAAPANNVSYIDWSAILAGMVLASAISLILLTFGSAVGLSMTSAREGQSVSLFWIAVTGGIWLIWVQLMASSAGGYLTGRMRRRTGDATEEESDLRDGSNGLVMWGTSTLVAAAIAYGGLTGAASLAGQAVGGVVSATGQAAAAAVDPAAMLIDRTVRGRPDAPALSENDRAAIGRILTSLATSEQGIDQADRDYLAATIAARTGVTPDEANARIDQIATQARQIEADARETAETARRTSVVVAFMTAASLLLGAVAAYFSATLGGNHRDKQTVITGWYRPW